MQFKNMCHRGLYSICSMVVVAILTVASLLAIGNSAMAAPEFVLDLEAGLACTFPLRLDVGASRKDMRVFVDKNGNPVRTLIAGTGSPIVYTNLSTGATFSTKANGAVIRTTFNSDGLQTVALTGHVVLILFPTDVPAGPTTTLHVGHVVYTVDANGVFTVQEVSGTRTDICALLSK